MKAMYLKYFSSIPTVGKNANMASLAACRKMMHTKQAIQNKLMDRFRKERILGDPMPADSSQTGNEQTERTGVTAF